MAKRRKRRKKPTSFLKIRAERFESASTRNYDWLLRVVTILFLFHVFYEDINTSNIEFTGSMFLDGFFNVVRLLFFFALVIVLITLKQSALRFSAFFLVLLGSVVKIIFIAFRETFSTHMFTYLLLIVIVSYYLPRYLKAIKRST